MQKIIVTSLFLICIGENVTLESLLQRFQDKMMMVDKLESTIFAQSLINSLQACKEEKEHKLEIVECY